MPLTHTRTFRVRHYECDGAGHLNHANYLRYMQEAAFDASREAGYGIGAYDALGAHWLIRETDIEYLHPLVYDDRVRVTTYVEDFRRVRSRRAYEFTREADDLLVARATTDWVYLDAQTGRPTPIPPEMAAAFRPEGSAQSAPRQRFPDAPPPPPGVYVVPRAVEWRDIDPMGHVNNATYLAYVEDAAFQASAAFGWPLARMQAEGFAIVARRHQIEYRLPALPGDELAVSTWFSDRRAASALRHTTISRPADDALLARAHTRWVWVDATTGRPLRLPPDLVESFAPNRSTG